MSSSVNCSEIKKTLSIYKYASFGSIFVISIIFIIVFIYKYWTRIKTGFSSSPYPTILTIVGLSFFISLGLEIGYWVDTKDSIVESEYAKNLHTYALYSGIPFALFVIVIFCYMLSHLGPLAAGAVLEMVNQ